MGKKSKSKRSRGEGSAAPEPAADLDVHHKARAEAEASVVAPVAVPMEVGGDVKALANMFALSESVFGKKTSYARAEAMEAKEKKPEKVKKIDAKTTDKKKDKKQLKKQQQQLLQAPDETQHTPNVESKDETKTDDKKDSKKKKKDKKKAQQQALEETEEATEKETAAPAEDADEGDKKKDKKKNRKLKQKIKKKTNAKPSVDAQGDEKEGEKEEKGDDETEGAEVEATAETTGDKQADATAKPVDETKSRRTVFVGNVSLDASEKDVARHFAPCGKVEAVRLRNLPVAGCAVDQAGNQKLMMKVCANKKIFNDRRETCNAYVVFAAEESVPAALALDGSTLLSKKLKVDRETLVVDPRRSVFVGNLAFQLPDDQLRAYFNARLRSDEEPEPVENVRVVRDRESGLGKGFGYVLLKTSSLAAKALSLHETKLGTREIRVQVCGKRTKNRRGEESDPSKKHEGLRAAAGARARILLKRKTGSEAAATKRQKLDAAVKTIKPKHAARKARQADEAAAGAGDKKKSGKRPRAESDQPAGGRKSAAGARPAKKPKAQKDKAQKPKAQKPKAQKPKAQKPKAQKPKHAARKDRQAAEAAASG